MRLARVWRGRSRCKLEKFPYGSKMSATLLIEFLMCARCFSRTLSGPFLFVCVLYVCIRVCFKSHLEQIADSEPDLLQDRTGVYNLVSKQLHSGTAKLCSCPRWGDYRVKVRAMVRVRRILVRGNGSGKPPGKTISEIGYLCVSVGVFNPDPDPLQLV